MGLFTTPPKQSSLPKKRIQVTQHQKFIEPQMARVSKNTDYFTHGKIEVIFINRTKPAPIWVLESGASPKPEVGDFVLVGYIDGQKNNPFMAGIFSHKAWTSNFIRVEKGMIRIQFPTDPKDVDQSNSSSTKNHLRDDAKYLSSRAYVQVDASGIKVHAPAGLDVTLEADTVNVVSRDGSGSPKAVARVGDSVDLATGKITSGSDTLKSV